MQIKSLANVPKESLIETINLAFSDYDFKVFLTSQSYDELIRGRSIDLEKSIGCFDDNLLVGFILVGFRTLGSTKYYYDAATAVIPTYRNKKIGSLLLNHFVSIIKKENGIFILEVLENNEIAKNLYLKADFKISRTFYCYIIEKSKIIKPRNLNNYTIKNLNKQQFIDLNTADFDSFDPCWQNSKISILNDWKNYKVLTISEDDEIIGYGVIREKKGDITQLSLKTQNREIANANALLYNLVKLSCQEKITILNLEEGDYLNSFLIELGWRNFVNQIEMRLQIDKKIDA